MPQNRSQVAIYLEELKGSQQFSSSAVASVNLKVLQLRGKPRGAVVLLAHLDGGLGEGATDELRLALLAASSSWRWAVGDSHKG